MVTHRNEVRADSMSNWRTPFSNAAAVLAALIVCVAPFLGGLDHGGAFAWTQWAMASTALVAVAVALVALIAQPATHGLWSHRVAGLLGCIAVFAVLQTVPLNSMFGRLFASGSQSIYAGWMSPVELSATDARANVFAAPISLAPWLTWSTFGVLATALGFAVVGSAVITTRGRTMWMLLAFTVAGAAHAGLGIIGLIKEPGETIWGQPASAPFGAFLNGNNACVLIVLGLASALGLLAWRMTALVGSPSGRHRFNAETLRDLLLDRIALWAAFAGTICFAGLLVSGSRGGLAGAVFGLPVVLVFFRAFSRGQGLVTAVVAAGLIGVLLLSQFKLPLRSVEEIRSSEGSITTSVLRDGRLEHWPDGLQAARMHWAAGAGLGAYRYAYLPYQTSDVRTWFLHADNLWLEWLVETGFVGVVLLMLLLWCVGSALWQLGHSSDPLEFGLGTAGIFAFACLAFTQFFDFGLALAPNAAATAVLFSAVVTHASALARQQTKRSPAPRSERTLYQHNRLSTAVALLAVIALCGVAIDVLHAAAESEYLVRTASSVADSDEADLENLPSILERLRQHVQQHPLDSIAAVRLSQLQVLAVRRQAVQQAAATTPTADLRHLQQLLKPNRLRSVWYARQDSQRLPESAAAPLLRVSESEASTLSAAELASREQLADQMESARRNAVAALYGAPLSDEVRFQLVQLDFAGGSPRQSRELLMQMANLRRHNPTSLKQVAKLAMAGQMWDLSRDIWRRILVIDSSQVGAAVRAVRERGPLRPSDVVPPTAEALRVAALAELNQSQPDERLLANAVEMLANQLADPATEQDETLRLLARIESKRNRPQAAVGYWEQAVRQSPEDVGLLVNYAETLQACGQTAAAQQQIRSALQLAPEDAGALRLLRQFNAPAAESNTNSRL